MLRARGPILEWTTDSDKKQEQFRTKLFELCLQQGRDPWDLAAELHVEKDVFPNTFASRRRRRVEMYDMAAIVGLKFIQA